jgi:predicted transposase/invertase (TIGR01784 family)
MYQSDMDSNIATARDRGKQEGILDVARNLLRMNMPINQIGTATGLTQDEVENLRLTL